MKALYRVYVAYRRMYNTSAIATYNLFKNDCQENLLSKARFLERNLSWTGINNCYAGDRKYKQREPFII